MVWTGILKESLKVICQQLRMALDIAPDGRNTLFIGTLRFFFNVVVVGCGCNPLRAPVSPLLAALGVLAALDGDAGWHCLAVIGDHFPAS
jgi:hypothetical protein